jgi:hypothetical protein
VWTLGGLCEGVSGCIPNPVNCGIRCRSGLRHLTSSLYHARLAPDTSKLHHNSHDMSQDSPRIPPNSSLTYKVNGEDPLTSSPHLHTYLLARTTQPTYHQHQLPKPEKCSTPKQRHPTRPVPAVPHGPTPRRSRTSSCYARTRAKSKPRSPYILPVPLHIPPLTCFN